MRKIIAAEFMSLDGVVEAPQNWHFPFLSPDMQAEVNKQILESDAFLFGRLTYEEFASYWPTATDDETGIADRLNSAPKYVVTTTLEKADWNPATLIKANVIEEIRKLKQQAGGNIGVSGSPTLLRSLMQAGLVDEYWLFLHPVVVGSGKRLFKDGMNTTGLKLAECKTFSGGVVFLRYQPNGKEPA